MKKTFQVSVFIFFWYSEVELLDHMLILYLNFVEPLTVFHHGCTHVQSQQHCMRGPFSPYSHLHFLFLVFLMVAILTSLRWYFIVVLISISLTISDIESIFSRGYWPSLCCLWERVYLGSSAHFLIGLFLWCWVVLILYVFWILIPYHR